MKAVIMAGGEGTRLRPLTNLRPKPMVPICNRPIMEHILGLVKWHGIEDVVATLQFMPQVIQNHFGDGEEWGMRIHYALEETPLGTAGSVKNAEELLDETFLVISGDALTDIDLSEVVRFHKEKGAMVTIALKRVPDPLEFGVVITAEDGRVERFLEKPTWGQVFSDTINTGIYVMEPEVLDLIPPGEQFDFSSHVFPMLMEKGLPLYGAVMDGYWCDVGNLGAYVQANFDALDRRLGLWIPGVQSANEVWVGEGARIDPTAVIGDKVVIGANCQIAAGAQVDDYTVLGDNCYVGKDTLIERTIAWADSFFGAGSSLRGGVVGRGADVREGATLSPGSVIGDETMVGRGATVANDVIVYPFKRIEPGAVVSSALIWESRGGGSLFGAEGVSGLVNVDITPELALKLAQAYASTLPAGSHVVCSRDSSAAARMIKRAMVAGLNSAGVNARDLRVASPSVCRFTTRETRCAGGIHLASSPNDVNTLEIHFYDSSGLDLAPGEQKKIERLHSRQEFRRSFFDQIGQIIYPPRALEYYTAGLADALGDVAEDEPRYKVVADTAYGMSAIVMPHVAERMHIDLMSLSSFIDAERTYVTPEEREGSIERLRTLAVAFAPDVAASFDVSGECLTLITRGGRVLDGDTALHALVELWCSSDTTGLPVGVPVTASRVVECIAARHDRGVVRSGRTRRQLSTLAVSGTVGLVGSQEGGYIFPNFIAAYDAVMSLGAIVRLLAGSGQSLDEVVDGLPSFHLRDKAVFCPDSAKGAVMRAVADAVVGLPSSMTEGVHVEIDGGWVLVLPDASEPLVNVYTEGPDAETAEALLERFGSIVSETVPAAVRSAMSTGA